MTDLFDLYANPRLTRADTGMISGFSTARLKAAWGEISSWPNYQPSPLASLSGLARTMGIDTIWYKDEGNRFGIGSFKALGGAYAVLRLLQTEIKERTGVIPTSEELRNGKYRELTETVTVSTATDGNHGRSVAWGASVFHCRSVIYLPRSCTQNREHIISSYGAKIVRCKGQYDETVRECTVDARHFGRLVVSDTSWDGYEQIPMIVMQGYTVCTAEIVDQLGMNGPPTHVFVQGGVGGLAAAVHAYFCRLWGARRPRLVVVEPSGAACLHASALAGKPTPAQGEVRTIMAGLACGQVSRVAWKLLVRGADFFMTVPDLVVPACMKLLARSPHGDLPIVAGESAVAGLAGLLCALENPRARNQLGLDSSSSVLLFGTEGDTDPELYRELTGAAGDAVQSQ
jgi:diaminopropionate ammonia-lyase